MSISSLPSNPSFAQKAWSTSKPVLTSSVWWRQQVWVVLTEVLMGFLAVLGLARGLGISDVALGLGLAYALSWGGLIPLVRGNRWQAAGIGLTVVLLAITSLFATPTQSWWLMAAATGLLLAFRDAQSIRAFLWVPLRAMRQNGAPFGAMQAGQGFAIIHGAIWLIVSAWMLQHVTWWPAFILLVAVGVGVPDVVRQRPKTSPPPPARMLRVSKRKTPSVFWMVRLSGWFNAAHFLGRRLVLPVAMVQAAHHFGMGQQAILLIGALLSVLALVAAMVRQWTRMPTAPRAMMIKGLEMSILGWLIVVASVAFIFTNPNLYALSAAVVGWVILEVAIRFWSVGYMETLRLESTYGHRQRSRSHKEALTHFMRHKNAAGAAGFVIAGLAAPGVAPFLVGGLSVMCWHVLRRGRHTLKAHKND